MRQIRDTGKVVGLDRTAIMAALNLANELLQSRTHDDLMDSSLELRIKTMRQRVESALESGKQLEL